MHRQGGSQHDTAFLEPTPLPAHLMTLKFLFAFVLQSNTNGNDALDFEAERDREKEDTKDRSSVRATDIITLHSEIPRYISCVKDGFSLTSH